MADDLKFENERDEDSGLSMVDVLEEEKLLEEDAKAVLGDSDDKNCTYPLGYIPRQAMYSCITCVPPSEPSAGVCLACSYECHEGHELVELYTKRNFRCDCGNSKFKEMKCKLCPTKLPSNSENQYNQNFTGRYCTCHRPYPDPDESVEDEMIQCVVCEDWYHGRHLEGKVPSGNDYDEMICQTCMKKNDFLWAYNICSEVTTINKNDTNNPVDVENTPKDEKKPLTDLAASRTSKDNDTLKLQCSTATVATHDSVVPEDANCLLVELQQRQKGVQKGASFWPIGWRIKLCKCIQCKTRYDARSVTFLLESEDTVHAYEERGKQKHGTSSDYDQGMRALSSMNRVQQVEFIHGYNNLKDELKDYLKKFAENGKMVREEDIREFFSEMQARKKQRPEGTGGIQWGCR